MYLELFYCVKRNKREPQNLCDKKAVISLNPAKRCRGYQNHLIID